MAGGRPSRGKGSSTGGLFGDVKAGMRIAQEEIFGPTTALIPVKGFEEAVATANSVRYGLSSSIFTG